MKNSDGGVFVHYVHYVHCIPFSPNKKGASCRAPFLFPVTVPFSLPALLQALLPERP